MSMIVCSATLIAFAPPFVQIGTPADGTPIRWRFTEISPDSFLSTGEALQSDGKTWKLQGQFRARRLAITSFEKGQSL